MADAVPPVVVDGGLATLLEAWGHDLSGPLWSARVLTERPDAIRAAHAAYVRAGARVVTTASYQVSLTSCAAAGLDGAQTERLLRRSVVLARDAAASTGGADIIGSAGRAGATAPTSGPKAATSTGGADVGPPAGQLPVGSPAPGVDVPVRVAASVGPYGAARADGSEYRGRYGLRRAALRDWHAHRLDILLAAGPDLLALETIPDLDEAEALLELVAGADVPAWLSYTVAGKRTRAGQPLAEAFAATASVQQVVAVGVNCCDPDDVGPAMAIRGQVGAPPGIAYPNSGERWDPRRRAWSGPRRDLTRLAPSWVRAGARYVGGCCRVGPADIAALAGTFTAARTDRSDPVP